MRALHVICKKKPGGKAGRVGVRSINPEKALFTSEAWIRSGWTPDTIIGAMLYMHETQATPSQLGGEITDCELFSPKSADQPNDRYRFTFRNMKEGRGVKWRGNRGPTEQGGLVEV